MGLTNERFVVKESRRARRKTAVRFLIDSGAVYSLVPGPTLKKLGIRPHRTVDFALADGTTITRQVGALLSRSAFTDFKKRLDHTEYGGAPLLGVKGACIITHGSSNANAIKNAVRVAAEFSERGINGSIERGLAALRPAPVCTV